MIFLSHTQVDKPLVEKIAIPLALTFGQNKVFYDSWSIQPGEGIIDKMNLALENCKYFFFFVSQNSLQSNMVKLEWQTALYKRAKEQINFIPVKIDNSMMPIIMAHILYIDLYGQGHETAIRQMIDIISGNNTFRPELGFQNIRAYIIKKSETKIIMEFRAEVYMEPHSQYGILLNNSRDDINYKAYEGMFDSGFHQDLVLDNGLKGNLVQLGRASATSPNFPFTIEIESKTKLNILGAMRAISNNKLVLIPLIDLSDSPNRI